MGTSFQQEVGSDPYKRTNASIQHDRPEIVVDIRGNWKQKGRSSCVSSHLENSHTKIFEHGQSFTRVTEDGCPKAVKVERTLKLREEDNRARPFNILTNTKHDESWR